MMNLQDRITIFGLTDTGLVRKKNEDAIGFDSALGLVVLADGMGGHLGGEIASGLTVDKIIDTVQKNLLAIEPRQTDPDNGLSLESICIQEAVESANRLVFKTAEDNPEYHGMGTTVVVLQFYNNTLTLAHIGDSRCYRFRRDKLEQITKDHSLNQELIDRGFYRPEEAKKLMNKNLVTRALGIEPLVTADIQEDIVIKGDIYLLCSDGLTDLVEDEYIYLTIKRFSDNPEEAAKQLIAKANKNGGKDNISVMLCQINQDFSTKSERRNSVRKVICTSCVAQFPSGITINGKTKDLSLDGALIESTSISSNDQDNPSIGDIGLLTLKFNTGAVENEMRVPCQARHLGTDGIGLLIHFIKLKIDEQDLLRQVIASNNAEFD